MTKEKSKIEVMEGHPQHGVDRLSQWSSMETKEFLSIRASLQSLFTESRRNKTLWDEVSARMKKKGYARSSEQCKCKWKNMVSRYKRSESMESSSSRLLPFYEELQAIFMMKTKDFECPILGISSSAGSLKEEKNFPHGYLKKKSKKIGHYNDFQKLLLRILKQHMDMEVQWHEEDVAVEEERRMKEIQWRQELETVEKERMDFERMWGESRQKRWIREDKIDERKNTLFTLLLGKINLEIN